jgi:hypothetical protein
MASIDEESEVQRLADRVEALCDAGQQSGRPYLISALGIELGEDLARIKTLTKSGLADFLRSRLSEKFELVRFGTHGNVLAVIPVGGSLPPPVENSDDGTQLDSQGRAKFHYRLWAAFSVPPEKACRFLNLNDLTFVDVDSEEEAPADSLAIPLNVIPPGDQPRRDDIIWENVNAWLEENRFPPERFYASNRRTARIPRSQQPQGGSLLDAVVTALDRRQLQNTQMSLDVVAALLQTRR